MQESQFRYSKSSFRDLISVFEIDPLRIDFLKANSEFPKAKILQQTNPEKKNIIKSKPKEEKTSSNRFP